MVFKCSSRRNDHARSINFTIPRVETSAKKPSLVTANDGLMEEMLNTNIYSIPKQSRLQAKRQKYSLLEWITRVGSKKTIQGVRIC